MPIRRIASSTAAVASLSDLPGARLNEIVVATNEPWWLTANGVLPGPYVVKEASGTIVSLLVLTAAPDEAEPLPVLANALVDALRAELPAMLAAVVALLVAPASFAAAAATVPTTAFVVSVPLAFPP